LAAVFVGVLRATVLVGVDVGVCCGAESTGAAVGGAGAAATFRAESGRAAFVAGAFPPPDISATPIPTAATMPTPAPTKTGIFDFFFGTGLGPRSWTSETCSNPRPRSLADLGR